MTRSSVRGSVTPVAVLAFVVTLTAVLTGGAAATARPSTPSPVQGTHTLSIHGVMLQVPTSWHLVHTKGLPGCIVDPDAPKPTEGAANFWINNCQLQVLAGTSLPTAAAVPDTINLKGPGIPARCIPNRRTNRVVGFSTARASTSQVGDSVAEYVRFTSRCLVHPLEAWFVGAQPGVLISRSRALVSTEPEARRAVASAVLPPSGPGLPRGFIGEPLAAGATTVRLAPSRLFFTGRYQESAQRTGAAPVRFHLPARRTIGYVDRYGDLHRLSRRQFVHDVRHGFPRAGGLRPEVTLGSDVGSDTVRRARVTLATRH